MTDTDFIYFACGRIEAHHDKALRAAVTKYHRTCARPGEFLQEGVRAGPDHSTGKGIRNRVVDVSAEKEKMSDMDNTGREVSQEFRELVRAAALRQIVFLPPAPNTAVASPERGWPTALAGELWPGFHAGAVYDPASVAPVSDLDGFERGKRL